MMEQSKGDWGETGELKWDREPEELPGRLPEKPKAESLTDTPELGWDTPKKDIDAYTGRKVEPIEEVPAERAKLDAKRAELYKAHHPESDEGLDDVAA